MSQVLCRTSFYVLVVGCVEFSSDEYETCGEKLMGFGLGTEIDAQLVTYYCLLDDLHYVARACADG